MLERSGDEGIVRQRLPRETALRRAPRLPGRPPLVVATHVDLVLVVLSIRQPDFSAGLVDRALVLASLCGIDAALCVNKWDLADDEDGDVLLPYRDAGVRVVRTSALDGSGIDELAELLRDHASVVVGHSGVGKSSLLARLVPGMEVRVQEVNQVTGRGRHTTTTATLVHLPDGGTLIDTPGIRAFGLFDLRPEKLAHHYPEFVPHLPRCEFENCMHDTEPDCAVKRALERGEIHPTRHEVYLRILASLQQGRG
jgi:ribosome biogenesis GTPase